MTRTQGKAGTFAALVAVLAVAAGCGKSAERRELRRPRRPARTRRRRPARGPRRPTSSRSRRRRRPVTSASRWSGACTARRTRSTRSSRSTTRRTRSCSTCARRSSSSSPTDRSAPGLGDVANPDPTTFVITLKDGVTFWDGTPLTADDVVFSLGRARDAEARRLLPAGLRPGEGHQGDRTARGHGHDDRARLLAPQRAVRPGRRGRREGVRRGAGREVRHRRRRHHVHRPVQARLLEDRRGRHGRARTTPTGTRPAPARSRR